MRYFVFGAAVAAAVTFGSASAGAQGIRRGPVSPAEWCAFHRNECVQRRDVRFDRYDIHQDRRDIERERAALRKVEHEREKARARREREMARYDRANKDRAQHIADAQYRNIFGDRSGSHRY
jgi:hypothetical protein